MNSLLIYGANGYSAKLILEELLARNILPILAGRSKSAIAGLAKQYNCSYKIFDLNGSGKIINELEGIHTIINCAGPFKYTARKIIDACLVSKTNYIDITGEIDVIDYAWQKNEAAKEAGVTILPGAGFDVIPTDCLAKSLSDQLPDASTLELVILNNGKISRGTFLTTVEMMREGGKIRKGGEITDSPIAEYVLNEKRSGLNINGISIPWGDVCSAYYSTNIPDIKVYLHLNNFIFSIRKLLLPCLKHLSFDLIFKTVNSLISSSVTGPVKNVRDNSSAIIWGRVKNKEGNFAEEAYKFMDGYNLTAIGTADCAENFIKENISAGTTTPSLAFGKDFKNKFILEKII